LSINTEILTRTQKFFPVKRPLAVMAGYSIIASIGRKSEKGPVWFEWTLQVPVALPIQNANGATHQLQNVKAWTPA
jgi:hypothetical protein